MYLCDYVYKMCVWVCVCACACVCVCVFTHVLHLMGVCVCVGAFTRELQLIMIVLYLMPCFHSFSQLQLMSHLHF